MKLLLRCSRFVTGPPGKAETSMRSIPNSGYYWILSFFLTCSVVVTHLSVCIVLNQTLCCFFFVVVCFFYFLGLFMSNPRWLCLLLSVCLSPVSLPLGLHPRIFSHPNVLPMLGACQSPPAPHPIIITHWMPYGSLYNVLHEGTSEYSGHKVHTYHQLWWFAGICDVLHLKHWSLCFHHFLCLSTCYVVKIQTAETSFFMLLILMSDFVVDQTQAVKFALDIACGMAFLHTLEPMIPRHYLNSKSVMVRRCCDFSDAFCDIIYPAVVLKWTFVPHFHR